MRADIVGLSFAVEAGKACYIPLAHDYAGAPEQLDREDGWRAEADGWKTPTAPKLGHHLKYDINVLANHGIAVQGMRHDSMLESYVLERHGHASRHGFAGAEVPGLRHHQVRARSPARAPGRSASRRSTGNRLRATPPKTPT